MKGTRETNPSAPPGKAKTDGGGSHGKEAKLGKSCQTPMESSKGTPKDKGVNR
jgi:hypothetical protein